MPSLHICERRRQKSAQIQSRLLRNAALQEQITQLESDDDERRRERERDDADPIERKARARAPQVRLLGHLRVPQPLAVSPQLHRAAAAVTPP
jgi:hypothetical protein